MRILNIMSVTVFLVLLTSLVARAQVIVPAGQTERKASQLVGWIHDEQDDESPEQSPEDPVMNVTNTSNTSSVFIHIQAWVSEDGGGDPAVPDDFCNEVNWCDELTPNDTHSFALDDIILNTDPCLTGVGDCGEVVDIELVGDQGFFTITPVVSCTDRRAIAYNHLTGSMSVEDDLVIGFNTVGREARSFIDGSLLADGTLLDGITGGYVLIQPEVLMFNFNACVANVIDGDDALIEDCRDDVTGDPEPLRQGFMDDAHVVTIMFSDDYSGPFGDYRSTPATATFDPLIVDEVEQFTSCNTFTPTCIRNQGINLVIDNENDAPDGAANDDSDPHGTNILCPGNTLDTGWVRLAVSGVSDITNVIGLVSFVDDDSSSYAGAMWMTAEGEKEFPTPATPTPTVEPSVTPTPDGSPTPTGGGEPGGGGGSGCAITGPVEAGTALANMLMVLLPGAAFALRRRFSK